MSQDDKWKMAERLVELILKDSFPPKLRPNAPALMKEMLNTVGNKVNDLQVELHAKHYSEDQLRTLLNFYESDMGASILLAQSDISTEFKSRFSEISADVNSDNSGGIGVKIRRRPRSNEGDTDESNT